VPLKKPVQIKVAPNRSLDLGIRIRCRPKKSVVAAIKRFDQLVERGLVSNLEITREGVISGGNISSHLSQADYAAIRRVITLSHEHIGRARSKVSTSGDVDLFHKRQESKIAAWESKGGFDWLHPALEEDILKGRNPLFTLTLAERTYGKRSEGLRAIVNRYIARPESLTANLKKQLVFFRGELLKQKGKKEIVVASEIGPEDKATTVVKLVGQSVVRETVAMIPSMNIRETLTVTLLPSGKITYSKTEGKMFN